MEKELNRVLKLKIKNNTYEVKFPNTGQLIDIEQKKSQISIKDKTNVSGFWAHNLAMAIATFEILIPDLKKDLNVDSFWKMELEDSNELVRAYVNEFLPWFNPWIDSISSVLLKDE